MTVQPADLFGAPWRDFQQSDRPTPDEMGGWKIRPPHEQAARQSGMDQVAPVHNDDAALAAGLQRQVEQHRARRIPLVGTGTGTASDPAIIRLGGPKPGFVRGIRRLTVGPADYLNIATGPTRVIIAVTSVATATIAAPLSATRVISTTTAWPAEGTWGRGELILEAGDELVALILGSSNGVTYTAGGLAEETGAATGEFYEL